MFDYVFFIKKQLELTFNLRTSWLKFYTKFFKIFFFLYAFFHCPYFFHINALIFVFQKPPYIFLVH